MRSTKRIGVTALALAFCLLALPVAALAQAPNQIFVNYPDVQEGADSVSLGLYFTLLDASGQVVQEAEITSAQIELDDGSSYEANAAQPESNAYVILVLDASGSMAGAMPQMREAAIQAVDNAPDEAVFAVLQFNDELNLIQDFTDNRNQVSEQIDTIRAVDGAGTCLYDATYRAIELLNQTPLGRRAVILFTDGNDMTIQGTPCSTHTYREVVDFATQQGQRVPIHTIGLSTDDSEGAINADELSEMASLTGGFSEIGEVNSLNLLFQRIINGLSSQWLARADVYPHAGENTAVLVVTMEDGSTLQSAPVSFTASRDYEAPPSAVVDSISYTDAGDVVFDLSLSNAERLSQFELQLVDVRDNVPQPPFTADVTEQLTVEAGRMESGQEYDLLIRGLGASDQVLFETVYNFRYNPNIAEGELLITSVQLDRETREFLVDVRATNIQGLEGYTVWLNDQGTNTVVPGSRFTTGPEPSFTIPLEDIPNGLYQINVSAVGVDGNVLAEATYDDAQYRIGMFSRMGTSVRNSLIVLGVLGLIVAVAVIVLFKVLVLDPRKQKSQPILLENTMIRQSGDASGLEDWGEDAIRARKRRLKAASARVQERETPPPAPSSAPPAERAAPSPSAAPRARLVVLEAPGGGLSGMVYPVESLPLTIGREGADVSLGLQSVSRRHAVISYREGRFFIRDDRSTNGTTVNGRAITGQGEVTLPPGAVIALGKSLQLRFDVKGQ
jgi:Mg-chelatase subunit ChlD